MNEDACPIEKMGIFHCNVSFRELFLQSTRLCFTVFCGAHVGLANGCGKPLTKKNLLKRQDSCGEKKDWIINVHLSNELVNSKKHWVP